MSNEASVQARLRIRKASGSLVLIDYLSGQASFFADVDGTKGPAPGAVTISTTGTDIDLSQLDTPGLVRLSNQDPSNFVEYGIKEPGGGVFYPLGELLPGESYILRFSRNMGQDWLEPGTGTGPEVNHFHMRANTAAVNVLVEAFER